MPGGFLHEPTVGGSTEWYTPPHIFEALGIDFDLDPAAPPGGLAWIPAQHFLSEADDGLSSAWQGRVWLNPPYGRGVERWMRRLALHGSGMALVFARTDTRWWQEAIENASAVCFLAGRLRFVSAVGEPAHSAPAPSALLAFGLTCAMALAEAELGSTLVVPSRSKNRGRDRIAKQESQL